MKKNSLFIFLCILLCAGCEKDESILPTIRVTKMPVGFTGSLNAISFNGSTGLVAGESGIIFRYVDGNWNSDASINTNGTDFNAISIPTPDIAYISGEGKLFKSTDGGVTWNLINASYDFDDASFPTANIGYMISSTDVFKTTNGGLSWSGTSFPITSFQPYFIATAGPDSVWVTDFDGDVYFTGNGGTSWTMGARPGRTGPIYFRDNLFGIAISDGIYITRNGGTTWQKGVDLDDFGISGMHMPNATNGYAVGNQCIYVTRDGGDSWEYRFMQDGTSINDNLRDVYFIDGKTGFAVSEEGFIYKLEEEKF